jgi:succinate dehydrogenase/fumarate reductase flavoprotein subunit
MNSPGKDVKQQPIETIAVDVLVLGGGMAGHRAALAARREGMSVAHAYLARGASSFMICANVPLGCVDPNDSVEAYSSDMIKGGYGLNDRRLVDVMARNAIPSFDDLVDLGVPFMRDENGYAQRLLAGNSYPRGIYTSTGGMGPVIMDVLSQKADELGVRLLASSYVVTLLRDGKKVIGALLADYRKGTLTAVTAKSVVLAMGGIGRLYEASTYPSDVSADSYALALEAGATLIDMEFVQFEPVVTVHPDGCRGMEMPTAMLGDGAQLLNKDGERFMFRYNPEHGERLVEKAKMSIFIQQEIDEGRGLPDGTIYFNTTTVPSDKLESYVSHCKRLRRAGLEPTTDMPRVRPAAHSQMGGVFIDEHGFSGIPGLFACGESSGGVHGASRMAGNSGAETLVMGWVVGKAAAAAARTGAASGADVAKFVQSAASDFYRSSSGAADSAAIRREIGDLMAEKAGLYRDSPSLQAGLDRLQQLEDEARDLSANSFKVAMEARTTRNMIVVAKLILQSALTRTESRGAHRRLDFPAQDDSQWLKHVSLRPASAGTAPVIAFLPIH